MEGDLRIPLRTEDPGRIERFVGVLLYRGSCVSWEITYLSMIILFVCTNPAAEIL